MRVYGRFRCRTDGGRRGQRLRPRPGQQRGLTWTGALQPGQSATITFTLKTNHRTFGDLKLDNTVVSDTPGTTDPRAPTAPGV
ncbi:hypothetical protein AB0D49_25845 [Streptomyces sp. NPDC048290]|uniref:hypothetical protein n=1 Tax=Streptomyces sp. NPDC048290 TaxID=3155811 RepID=UPI003436D043